MKNPLKSKISLRLAALLMCVLLAAASVVSCGSEEASGRSGKLKGVEDLLNEKTGGNKDTSAGESQDSDGNGSSSDGSSAGNSASTGNGESSSDGSSAGNSASTGDDSTSSDNSSADSSDSSANTGDKPEYDPSDIDIDLTVLGSTLVYSEVYRMVMDPDSYIGKIVKMKGKNAVLYDEASGNYYFACIIKDATACCAQGIEYELAGVEKKPETYPAADEEITVTGVFDTYYEGEYMYMTLRNSVLEG